MLALYIFIAGGIGAVLRWSLCKHLQTLMPHFPLGVMACNLLGCFLMGILAGLYPKPTPLSVALTVGLLGGFTTFSSFSLDSMKFLQNQEWGNLTFYTLGSLVLGTLLSWAGFCLSQQVLKSYFFAS